MTKYATMNPPGSTSPYDLFDNSQNLDFALNDITQAIWKDRFGRNRTTIWGMEQAFSAQLLSQQQRFNTFIQNSGYDVTGEYTAGPLTIREYNQLIRYNNELWKLKATTDVPFTTTGNDAASWANDSVHFVSVGDGVLRQELASPGGAGLVGGLLKPITWSGFAGGADPSGVNSSTAAFQASLDQIGYINMPPGEYLIDGSLNLTKSAVIFGAGRSLSKLKFSGNSATPFVKAALGYASTDLVYLRDFTAIAIVPNCGPLVSIKTDAAAQSASQVVVGDLDKLVINNVDAYGDSGGNYWNCGVEAVDCGGVHIHNLTVNNRTVAAQIDPTTAGFRFRTTAQKVSVIRALTAQDFYLLRMYYGIDTKPFNNLGGGITSYYISDFEIVGVRNGIRAQNWCATWRVTGHIDSTEQCLNFQGAAITNARFPGCDFRKGNNGGLGYVAGPMVTLDYGEQITFSGATFSGINLNLADPSNTAFSFTNSYNGNYVFLLTIDGNTFTKFHNVLGQTNGADIITVGNNSYNQIADAITFDSNLDQSFRLQTPIPSISQVVALPVGDSTFTVNVTANLFKNAPNYADARPVNNPSQAVRVVYDYTGSTASALLFRVYGVTTAGNFRFGITTA